VADGETILFAGGHFEFNDTTDQVTKYYFAGTTRIAMRKYVIPQSMEVEYLVPTSSTQRLGDHASTMLSTSLGSTIMRFISQSALVFGN
jgi:hypothetical protein